HVAAVDLADGEAHRAQVETRDRGNTGRAGHVGHAYVVALEDRAAHRAADDERTLAAVEAVGGEEDHGLGAAVDRVVADVLVLGAPPGGLLRGARERGVRHYGIEAEALAVGVQVARHLPVVDAVGRSVGLRVVLLGLAHVDDLHALAMGQGVDVVATHHQTPEIAIHDAVGEAGHADQPRVVGLGKVEDVQVRGHRLPRHRRADHQPLRLGPDGDIHRTV